MTIAFQPGMETELSTLHTPEAIRLRLRESLRPSLIRDAILGATDGCVTTFAVVAGAIGGDLPAKVVIILGCANLMADGFSMAASNFLGARTQNEELEEARAEEGRHIDGVPEGEREEVRQIFSAKGFSGAELESVVAVITADRSRWVDTMVTEELGLHNRDAKPLRAATVTFASFCVSGLFPLAAYLVPGVPGDWRFRASCAATAITFAGIGYFKGAILNRPRWKSACLTLLLGGGAAVSAYGVGFGLKSLMGLP
ncbi:MAG: VIT1/CCC1 transporter family protein [Fibrobacteria bacterium]